MIDNAAASSEPADDGDLGEEQFAIWVSDLAERVQAGEDLEFESLCKERPEFAQDLREVWGTLVVTEAIGAGVRAGSSHRELDSSSGPFPALQLPYEIGDYTLLEVVGRGGMGVVYRANQKSLNRIVAIKMIGENRTGNFEDHQRFFAEVEANARLEHPSIVPVYDFGEHEQMPYFSMQYVDGETLSQKIKAGPITQRDAARNDQQSCACNRLRT